MDVKTVLLCKTNVVNDYDCLLFAMYIPNAYCFKIIA